MAWVLIGNNYKAMKKYRLAEENYIQAFKVVPNRIYPLYQLTMLYLEQGDTVRAYQIGQKLVNFRPKVESAATIEMQQQIKNLLE